MGDLTCPSWKAHITTTGITHIDLRRVLSYHTSHTTDYCDVGIKTNFTHHSLLWCGYNNKLHTPLITVMWVRKTNFTHQTLGISPAASSKHTSHVKHWVFHQPYCPLSTTQALLQCRPYTHQSSIILQRYNCILHARACHVNFRKGALSLSIQQLLLQMRSWEHLKGPLFTSLSLCQ